MKNLTLLAAITTLAIFGCGHKDETVINTPDGSSATISKNGDSAHYEVTGKDGTKVTENIGSNGVSASDNKGNSFQASKGAVTEDNLGLPFYPGSDETAAGGSMISESPEGKSVICSRTTKDDPDKVTAFYKDKVQSASNTSSTAGETKFASVSGKLANGSNVSVVASKKGSEDTTILVTVGMKKK